MSHVPEQQSVHSAQPVQSPNVQGGVSSVQSQQQQQQTSQVVQQSTQHSATSVSSVVEVSGGGHQARGQAEVPIGTGIYQQHSAEIRYSHKESASGSQGVSEGSVGSAEVSGQRRQGRVRKEVIRLPDQPSGQVRQVRQRLPTPEPDTLERVYIRRTPAEIVEEITEIPTTPPPRIQERTVIEPAGSPKVIKRVIRVPPRGGAYGGYQQQQQGATFQSSSSQSEAAGFSNIQQAAASYQQQPTSSYQQQPISSYQQQPFGSYQQQAGATYSGGYSATTSFRGGFPPNSTPITHPITFTVGGVPGPFPPEGCHPAFCYYV